MDNKIVKIEIILDSEINDEDLYLYKRNHA